MRCCHFASREGISAGVGEWFASGIGSVQPDTLGMSDHTVRTSPTASLPLYLEPDHLPTAAVPLVTRLRPSWSPDKLSFKKFTDGITNTLVGCYLEDDASDMILIRIYGQNTDLLIDREAEKANFKLLSAAGYAPKLYAVFLNGLAYEYVHGDVLTKSDVCSPTIYPLVAEKMAKMHSLRDPNVTDTKPALWDRIEKYISLIPAVFRAEQQDKLRQLPGGVEKLLEETASLRSSLESEQSKVVFCHNDLLLANVVLGDSKVTFIDYEYAGYNYQAYDIGNHFAEFAGVTEVDYSLYPSKECQMKWLEIYLTEFRKCERISEPVTQDDVITLYKQVNKFALASHLLWAAWALVQAHHSSIDFDYLGYANLRMKEYYARKESFLSL